jgi:tRNA(Arg) A34 adenosine deaminase TadA
MASVSNPIFHGEVVAINDYVARHRDASWDRATLYSTGEPCVMCCGALAWAGIQRVVWASSVAAIRASGIPQIAISPLSRRPRAHTKSANPSCILAEYSPTNGQTVRNTGPVTRATLTASHVRCAKSDCRILGLPIKQRD